MRDYRYDHVHLRSADPDATARFFETMFGAEATRDVYPPGTLYPGQQRITLRLGGQTVLLAPPHPHEPTAPPPRFPYYGLEHIGLTVDDVDVYVPHQANIRIIDHAAHRLGMPREKVVVNVQKYGNTSSGSIPLALADAAAEGRLKPGAKVLMTGMGAGLTWGSGLIEWTEEMAA